MKQVIRVEHSDGFGMFVGRMENGGERGHAAREIVNALWRRHDNFNTPSEDGLFRTDKHFCAYKSIQQIQQWIEPEEFKILFSNGYKVLLLEVSDCQIGEHQAIYKKSCVVSSKDISQLFILNSAKSLGYESSITP